MTGTSSDVAFADAYVKGVNFDAEAAYDAALKNATVVPPASGVGRKGMSTSPFLGYTSTDTGEGLSWAMEGYVNDYGIAEMGQALYKRTGKKRYKEESAYFLNRAQDYVNLFDSKAGFFQGRDAQGNWRLDSSKYDPRVWGYDYTETNGWGTPSPRRRTHGASPTCTAARAGWPRSSTRTSPPRDGLTGLRGLLRWGHP